MDNLLNNPVYNALLSGDASLSFGTGNVRFFEKEVSPFAGFDDKYKNGFEEMYDQLPQGRKILYANPDKIEIPKGWILKANVEGLQFVLDKHSPPEKYVATPVMLDETNVEEMINLTALTKPGPFDKRTIEFGCYFGIFHNDQLVAMTGQRLHVENFTEMSAVCTLPDHLGKGFAATLLQHQINLILTHGETPFLHVRADNTRAIELYKRVGLKVSRLMNFYFLQRE
ncbi:MAG: GNAT family N-acetyltransferase [Ferruginibacter sp.]